MKFLNRSVTNISRILYCSLAFDYVKNNVAIVNNIRFQIILKPTVNKTSSFFEIPLTPLLFKSTYIRLHTITQSHNKSSPKRKWDIAAKVLFQVLYIDEYFFSKLVLWMRASFQFKERNVECAVSWCK